LDHGSGTAQVSPTAAPYFAAGAGEQPPVRAERQAIGRAVEGAQAVAGGRVPQPRRPVPPPVVARRRPSGLNPIPTTSAAPRGTADNLLEFIPDNMGGRLWNAYDLTQPTGEQVTGDPAVYTPPGGGAPHIYIRSNP
jgi:hypothetical protein